MELAQQSLLYAPTMMLGQPQGLPQLQGMYRQTAPLEGGLPELESSYGSIHRSSQETAMVQQSGGMGYGVDMSLSGHGLAGQQLPACVHTVPCTKQEIETPEPGYVGCWRVGGTVSRAFGAQGSC